MAGFNPTASWATSLSMAGPTMVSCLERFCPDFAALATPLEGSFPSASYKPFISSLDDKNLLKQPQNYLGTH